MKQTPKQRRKITSAEYKAIKLLAKCSFYFGSWDKRFVHSMYVFDASQYDPDNRVVPIGEITDAQGEWLRKLLYKYRRQLYLSDYQASSFFDKTYELETSNQDH